MLPKTTATQRASLYEDVEHLLSPGFLTQPIAVNGISLHLRSLCPGDLFMLGSRTAGVSEEDWHLWAVASSIWMIDGVSVLGKDESVPYLRAFLRDKLRRSVLDLLFYQLLGLFARVDKAVEGVQIYCFEQLSRYRWLTSQRGVNLGQGVPGGHHLGVNAVQGIWMAFNEVEDQHHLDEHQWEGFKFIASTNAPKAVKKIDASDKQRRQSEEARRQAALDRYYYYLKGVIDERGYKRDVEAGRMGSRVDGPKSVDDLEDEMRRWVSGEKDEHDRIVDAYKEGIREQQRQAREERERRRQAIQAERERMEQEAPMRGPQPLMGLTAEQLQRVLAERQPGPSTVKWLSEGPPRDQYLHDKWLAPPESAGQLQVQGGRLVAPGANPEQDLRRLSELVNQRRVTFGGGDD